MKRCALLVLGVGLLVAVAEGGKKDPKLVIEDRKKLQGEWTLVEGFMNGGAIPEKDLKEFKLTFKGDRFTLQVGDKTYVIPCELDPSQKPKAIDARPADGAFKGKTLRGIYQVAGDALKMCFANPDKDRPTEFTSRGKSIHILMVLKRSKK
jgi:uncharacterized protein (TIGR03067 family)